MAFFYVHFLGFSDVTHSVLNHHVVIGLSTELHSLAHIPQFLHEFVLHVTISSS